MGAAEFVEKAAEMVPPLHPFYPLGSEIVGYMPNDWNVPQMLAAFVGCMVILMVATNLVAGYSYPHLKGLDKFGLHWFILSESAAY